MTTRKTPITTGEIYHIYNRGVDKRNIVMEPDDSRRFMRSVKVFNTIEPVGSLREIETELSSGSTAGKPLVDIIAYCLNPNHFHFILRQRVDGGISEFMKRLSGGYTWYFNNKYKRSGSLFQGRYKSLHVDTNEYLLQLSVYVNLNFRVHNYNDSVTKKFIYSSWDEYCGESPQGVCEKSSVLGLFTSSQEYQSFAHQTIVGIYERKVLAQELGAGE